MKLGFKPHGVAADDQIDFEACRQTYICGLCITGSKNVQYHTRIKRFSGTAARVANGADAVVKPGDLSMMDHCVTNVTFIVLARPERCSNL